MLSSQAHTAVLALKNADTVSQYAALGAKLPAKATMRYKRRRTPRTRKNREETHVETDGAAHARRGVLPRTCFVRNPGGRAGLSDQAGALHRQFSAGRQR